MKKKFELSSSMKNVTKISTGTAAGQIVSIVSLPVITRIYGPEVMGVWTTIYAIATIVNTVSDLGLVQSIMMEDERKVHNTYSVVFMLACLISFVSMSVVFLYCVLILRYNAKQSIVIVLFTFIYSVTVQLVQLSYTWLNRKKSYSVLMKNPLINQISVAFFSIILGMFGLKQYGYYIGVIMGQILTLFHMQRYLPKKIVTPSIQVIKETIQSNIDFVKYQMLTNITLQIRNQLPILLIGGLFGNTILGYYSISQKMLNIPVTFIGQSLGKVFYQRCAEMQRSGARLGEFIYRNLKRAMMIAFVPMALLAAYGDAAIVMFFGTGYAVGGIIVRIIVFRSFFTFVSTATQGMDIVLKKQQYAMGVGIAQTIAVASMILLSFYSTGDIVVCCTMMTISFIIIQIVYFCVMFRVMEMSIIYYLRSIVVSLVAVVLVSLVLRYGFLFLTNLTGWPFFVFLREFMVLE